MAAPPTAAQPAVDLDAMLLSQTVWKANRAPATAHAQGEPTGHAALDDALPQRGWPKRALTELLLPADGIGELTLLLPTLARFTQAGGIVALVAPPYLPYAPAWQSAGVDLRHLEIIDADPRNALWTFEQCLRSAACAAVIGWPLNADGPSLRRLQVAADTGDCLGFALRDRKHAANPSPAALRMEYVQDDARAEPVDAMTDMRTGSAPHRDVRIERTASVHAMPRRDALPAPMTRSLPLFPARDAGTLFGSARLEPMRRIDSPVSTTASAGDEARGARWHPDAHADRDTDMPPASFADLACLRALAANARVRNEQRAGIDAPQSGEGVDRRHLRDDTARGNWHVRKCRGGNLPLRGVALQRLN